jgi:hypothetical protein
MTRLAMSAALLGQRRNVAQSRGVPMLGAVVSFTADGASLTGDVLAVTYGKRSIDVRATDGTIYTNIKEWDDCE